eukprot:scaffold102159_cov20-Tisochrysis_lutea.AAC.1
MEVSSSSHVSMWSSQQLRCKVGRFLQLHASLSGADASKLCEFTQLHSASLLHHTLARLLRMLGGIV